MEENILNRRNFFKLSLVAGGSLATSSLGGGSLLRAADSSSDAHAAHGTNTSQTQTATNVRGKMFFQQATEFDCLSAACERIYPKDDLGPGAIELGVPYFIDNQLAGAYGFNAREYMQGPFLKGIPEQGYQSPMYRRDIFLIGIHALEDYAQEKHKDSFANLKPTDQDNILKQFEADKVKIDGLSSKDFFTLLRDMTLAGAFADPMYQGNANKAGWKMLQYPGAQMNYFDQITSDEFANIEPMSLSDM